MSEVINTGSEFIQQIESVLLDHMSDEHFGVSELAEAMNMSRSNLLRKVKKETKLSASQYIRQVRLKKGMEILRQTSHTVSEVSYKVGFGSTSYFIKCFREYYGYPPGEVGKRVEEPSAQDTPKRKPWLLALIPLAIVLVIAFFFFSDASAPSNPMLEKSIAVLPFKNDSNDSSNLYFVNGLMESALSNLQKIQNLRVVSRTSVEKYRNSEKGIQEIAEELNVSYLVEGSGQKVGDQVLLNIQLIEASSDKHLWAEQYNRKVEDIFSLQNEVARKMVDAIQVIVTPEELAQIEKRPTDNLEAYDYYLQALDPFLSRTAEGLQKAIPLFEKAVELDPTFALAYANLAISYYFLDIWKDEKTYTELINNYADKALLYDAKLTESLIAKALYYRHVGKYRLALPHLEKALEYNPNSAAAVQMLAEHYTSYNPNTAKYLEYALKGIQLNFGANDSTTRSYVYLHLANAFIQSGFVDEAIKYINLSLDYNPANEYSSYVKAYILYAKDRDLDRTRKTMVREWMKDTTRLDILQEVGKLFYFQEKYDSAYYYYKKFVEAKKRWGISIYPQEDIKIGEVYRQMGYSDEAERLFKAYTEYCENDKSIYKSASLAVNHARLGENDQAIEQLRVFATQDNFQYWMVLFFEMDPLIKSLKSHPEFPGIMKKMEDHFWENHEQLKESLVDKGLI